MYFAISERQCRTPGAAENEPLLDAEMLAQLLHVSDQMRCGVVAYFAERRRSPGAALIEDHDAVVRRIEEPTVIGGTAGTGSAMEKDDGYTMRIARLFPIH